MPTTTQGKLTQSGLLYEGNFGEWRNRIDSILEILHLGQFTSASTRCTYHDPEAKKALNIMKAQISPAVSRRIPSRQHPCPCVLWRSLEGICRPFRLLDLPDEIRMRIYAHFVDDTGTAKPLERVCHPLRVETAAYWATKHRFCLEFPQDVLPSADLFAARVRSWVDALGRRNVKYLQNAIVIFGGSGRQGSETPQGMLLCFWPIGTLNLQICFNAPMDAPQPALEGASHVLSLPIGDIETDRHLLGLEGEAIVLALTTLASTWVKAYSEWLRISTGGKCE